MSDADGTWFREFFDRSKDHKTGIVEGLVEDPDAALERAADLFTAMGPDLAYADDRDHPMANSVLSCAALLAVYLTLREAGVDVHSFGSAMLRELNKAVQATRSRREQRGSQPDPEKAETGLNKLITAGAASQKQVMPGEFVFDVSRDNTGDGDLSQGWRMNVTACGICALFSQYDAMDLVPYMCATDDLMSDLGDEGLSRTGTIALGRTHCDFHYQPGQPTRHLSDLYPDRIQIRESS